jgi:hypothetical protein
VLAGKDPRTGEFLISAKGNAARAAARRDTEEQPVARLPETVNALRAAAHLNVSAQFVRMRSAGVRPTRRRVERSPPDETVEPPVANTNESALHATRGGSDPRSVLEFGECVAVVVVSRVRVASVAASSPMHMSPAW